MREYENLYDGLLEYSQDDYVPMHMPGHKRNGGVFEYGSPHFDAGMCDVKLTCGHGCDTDPLSQAMAIDITEIPGFDNLHHPEGILKEAQEKSALMYGAHRDWFLVNGSSVGLMAAIMAAVPRHGRILVARNCHISVYNAICENELEPVYIYPEIVEKLGISCGITATMVEKAMSVDNVDNIGAVIITSPTYEGNISQISEIAKVCHRHSAYLIVDEAHGAHFGFETHFPESALRQGADVVVQSLHKTLPALTQTAVLHMGAHVRDEEWLEERIDRYLGWFQSTSPSYVLMASIDRCIQFVGSKAGRSAFEDYAKRLIRLRKRINGLENIGLFETSDISKLVLCSKNGHLQGKALYDILNKRYKVQLEMAAGGYCIGMTSVADSQEYYDRLYEALKSLDERPEEYTDSGESPLKQMDECRDKNERHILDCATSAELPCEAIKQPEMRTLPCEAIEQPEMRMLPCEAIEQPWEWVLLEQSVGRVSCGFVTVYPPGIPTLCPGETVNAAALKYICDSLDDDIEVIGIRDGRIGCLK